MASVFYLVPRRRRIHTAVGQQGTAALASPASEWTKPALYGLPAGLLGAYLIGAPLLPGAALAVAVLAVGTYAYTRCPWYDAQSGQPVPGSALPASDPVCSTYETPLPASALIAAVTMVVVGLVRGKGR